MTVIVTVTVTMTMTVVNGSAEPAAGPRSANWGPCVVVDPFQNFGDPLSHSDKLPVTVPLA